MLPILLELAECYELTVNGKRHYTGHKAGGYSVIWRDTPQRCALAKLPGYAIMPDTAIEFARMLGAVLVPTPELRDFVILLTNTLTPDTLSV